MHPLSSTLFLLADAAAHGAQDVAQGFSSGNVLLIGAGALAVGVPLVLKLMGKSVPLLDPLLEGLLGLAEKLPPVTLGKPDPAKEAADMKQIADESAAAEEAAKVVPIDQGKKPPQP
jgi:hypothetical protein